MNLNELILFFGFPSGLGSLILGGVILGNYLDDRRARRFKEHAAGSGE